MKKIHYFRPRVRRGLHRQTYCCIENKIGDTYASSTHPERVTCQRCIDEINKEKSRNGTWEKKPVTVARIDKVVQGLPSGTIECINMSGEKIEEAALVVLDDKKNVKYKGIIKMDKKGKITVEEVK
jgi:hypothetical protein